MADEWAVRAGGAGQDKIRGLAVAEDGSIFIIGEFGQPGADCGKFKKTSAGELDFVLAKLSADGEFIWVASAGGPKIDRGYAVCLADDGGCYVTGHFESESIQFGDVELQSQGDYDSFVAKYDSHGKCLWAKRQGGGGYDYGHGIAPDRKGGCVVSGAFAATGTFGEIVFEHSKGRRAFLLRLDANGEEKWVREAGTKVENTAGTMSGHNLTTDLKGNIFLAGFQRGGADFGNDVSLPETKIQDNFVAKYNTEGEALWALGTGGASNGLATSVVADEKGGCYIAGMFQGTVAFAGKSVETIGAHDFYVAAVDSEGNGKWLETGGGEKTDYGLSLCVSGTGGCVLTGEITEKATFRGKGTSRNVEAKGMKDSFVIEYNTSGELLTVELFGGTDFDLSYAIGLAPNGDRIVSGAFRNETKIGAMDLTAKKGNDIFIARLSAK